MAEQTTTHAPPRLRRACRQDRILAELHAQPALRASELSQMLEVSHETIRRDLIDLDRRGLLRRTYGGAQRSLRFEAPVGERRFMHVDARERIGAEAAALARPGQVVMIGSGSTCWHAARRIATDCRAVTAITNDHAVAEALCGNDTIQIIMLGGRLHPGERYAWGPQAVEELTRYRADWAILGTSGIDGLGAHDIDDHAAGVLRRMIRQSRRVAILADRSKFGQAALARIAGWSEVDTVICDAPPDGPLAATLAGHGVDIRLPCAA
ncbi:MAG: DeoR/GlpR transcriptional regulator [Rhodobacteraceae bacterium]|jgi:DeoR/GlpR family transcriptional regulator of sugar metabolism|uniref:Transcriptional regulator of sugar metabolism n=1 Tax=Salipiger profundus TaxID=1229727 RepID=A0A1U7D8D7_9RHOB|nr:MULTISPECIES: DeoR/GlpR family DNA-binding transcription regulator [Salipiger]APX24378.1 transcriptional regulator of sugar metabolism [Salipiger profundus]MAB07320.1 DeoR/GlpR transcriptional regulator [Paracoccaceae bacterium]GGA19525.1 DeoR family transcriptional regulator [Salipiger profundus]SFD36899.1 transcriptional regulator, DeoR family [Salipiger profundus]